MIFTWTTGIYAANAFDFYGLATGENWIGSFTAPVNTAAPFLMLLGLGT